MASDNNDTPQKAVASTSMEPAPDGVPSVAKGMLADFHLFLAFVEASGEGIGWADLDGSIRYANAALAALIGMDNQADVLGISVAGLYDAETQKLLAEEVFPQILQGGIWTGELILRSQKGQLIPTMNRLFVLRNTDGSPACFGNLVTDLRESKKVEDEQRRQQERLEEMVAERTVALTQTSESLRKKKHTIKSASSAISTYSLEGVLDSGNPAFLQGWGYDSEEEVCGQHITDFLSVEDCYQEIQETLIADGTWSAEVPALRKDGAVFHVNVSAAVLRDDAGSPVGWMATTQNITERKRAQDLIRTQRDFAFRMSELSGLEESLDLCLELAIDISGMDGGGIYLVDEKTGCINLMRATGLSSEFRAEGAHYEPGSTNARIIMAAEPIYLGPDQLVALMSDSQRKEELCSLAVIPVQNEGRVIACVNVASHVSEEIPATVRTALETTVSQIGSSIARAKAQEALRASEETFRIIGSNARDTILMIDGEGRITYWSAAGQALLGYSTEDAVGQELHSLLGLTRADHNPVIQDGIEAIEALSSTDGMGSVIELDAFHKDGTKIPIEVSLSSQMERGDKNVVGIIRDIRERREAAAERERLEARLLHSQKMEAVGQLAGGVAHDFNNVLTGIIGYAEIAQAGLGAKDPLHNDLQEILNAADRASTLTKQLLAFSRKQVIAPKVAQPNDILDSSQRMLQRIIGEDIELSFVPAPDLWRILVDPIQLDQILVNLSVNARDAMADGGKLTFETHNVILDEAYCHSHSPVAPGEYVMLVVSDTGSGMESDIQNRAFEPFFSTKGKEKGTGLGLATVYGIVQQHHGHINIYSEVGIGTSFRVYFPRALGEIEMAQQPSLTALPTGTETVLLVEDERVVRNLALRVLENHGYQVIVASSGGQALVLAEKHQAKIDLLLTDVVMPAMNGRELHTRLVATRQDIKVLYMSGYTENVIAHHGVLDEGTKLIAKPFSIKSLLNTVREVLGGTE